MEGKILRNVPDPEVIEIKNQESARPDICYIKNSRYINLICIVRIVSFAL